MPSQYEADATYTDAELLAIYRELIARGAKAGVEYDIGSHGRGRRIVFPGMKEAREMIEWLEDRIADEELATAAVGGAQNLAVFNRAQ